MKISCTWEFIWKNTKTCSAKAGYLSVWEPEMQKDGKKYVSSSFPYSKFIVFGDWYRSAYRFYYITFSMSLSFYIKNPAMPYPFSQWNSINRVKGMTPHDTVGYWNQNWYIFLQILKCFKTEKVVPQVQREGEFS